MTDQGAGFAAQWLSGVVDRLGSSGRHSDGALAVSDIEVGPGYVTARVGSGSSDDAARVHVAVPTVPPGEVQAVVDSVASGPRLSAAVLTGELPPELGELAGFAAARPVEAVVTVDCSCARGDRGCRHLRTLGRWLGEAVAADPFVVVDLCGIDRSTLVEAIAASRGVGSDRSEGDESEDPLAAAARLPGPLPSRPPLPWRTGAPRSISTAPPVDSGVRAAVLEASVADAAQRAVDLLHGRSDGGLEGSLEHDMVRRAADLGDGSAEQVALGDGLGWGPVELRAAVAAWRVGGSAGLSVHLEGWDPEEAAMAAAARQLEMPRVRVRRNVVSAPGLQLRLATDGSWWRFEPDDELGWVLSGGGVEEVLDALDGSQPSGD